MVLEILWEKKIDYRIDETIQNKNFNKITFITLIRKYFSKILRKLLN